MRYHCVKEHTEVPTAVHKAISNLNRKELEQVARVGITLSSQAALELAQQLLSQPASHKTHCVRCHTNYDPGNCIGLDCIMDEHDENNGMIETSTPNGYEFMYACCHQIDRDDPYGFAGRYISTWAEGGAYWKDRSMDGDADDIECVVCDDEVCEQAQCCTCGKKKERHSTHENLDFVND